MSDIRIYRYPPLLFVRASATISHECTFGGDFLPNVNRFGTNLNCVVAIVQNFDIGIRSPSEAIKRDGVHLA
jgi:hypothetical protein